MINEKDWLLAEAKAHHPAPLIARCQAVNTRGSRCKMPGEVVGDRLVCRHHQENPPKKGWW